MNTLSRQLLLRDFQFSVSCPLFTLCKWMPALTGEKLKHEHDSGTKAIGEVGVSVHMLRLTHEVRQLVSV